MKPAAVEKRSSTWATALIASVLMATGGLGCSRTGQPAGRVPTNQEAWVELARKVFKADLHQAEWVDMGPYGEGAHSVWFKVGGTWGKGDVVSRASREIHRFLKAATDEKLLRNPQAVTFLVMVELTDSSGQASVEKVLNLNFVGADLKRVHWNEVSDYALLDLAQVTSSNRIGGEILAEYCSDQEHRKLTPAFCAKAAKP